MGTFTYTCSSPMVFCCHWWRSKGTVQPAVSRLGKKALRNVSTILKATQMVTKPSKTDSCTDCTLTCTSWISRESTLTFISLNMHRQMVIDILGHAREKKLFDLHGHEPHAYIHHCMVAIWGDAGTGGTCKKCGEKSVTVHMKQTRSADEGMTAIFTCSVCNLTWSI